MLKNNKIMFHAFEKIYRQVIISPIKILQWLPFHLEQRIQDLNPLLFWVHLLLFSSLIELHTASFLFLKQVTCSFTPGPLHSPFPLLGMFYIPYASIRLMLSPWNLCLNVTFLEKPFLVTLFLPVIQHSLSLSLLYFSAHHHLTYYMFSCLNFVSLCQNITLREVSVLYLKQCLAQDRPAIILVEWMNGVYIV